MYNDGQRFSALGFKSVFKKETLCHRAIHLACILALFATSAFSQTFGEITGEVRDSSGAVIGGANVTIINAGTNAARTTATNDAGVYSFPALNPGT